MRATFDGTGEVVVVTGGARGIGAALAAAAARAGAAVVVFDNAIAGSSLHGTPGIELVDVDVSDPDHVAKAVSGVIERHGRIDGLVAGAAVQPRSRVLETDPADWTHTLKVNLDGVVWVCQAVVPHMVERHNGSVVIFTSGLARTGFPGAAAYASSKAALTAFARTLAAEVAEHRVRVNLVSPGVIDTEQFRHANEGPDLDHWRATTGIGDPEDVVGPLLFLLSDAAGLTGSLITRERAFTRLTDF